MKLFARLHVIAAASFLLVIFTFSVLPTLHPIARARKVWDRSFTHIVVFGNSWSSSKPSLGPGGKQEATSWLSRLDGSGHYKLWVDVLCSEVQ